MPSPHRGPVVFLYLLPLALAGAASAPAQPLDTNEPGILEPVTTQLQGKEIRVPNTDQSVDGVEQSLVHGAIVYADAPETTSLLGHPITRVSSPNDDMRLALQAMLAAAERDDAPAMQGAARELMDILLGTTEGRIYDGFSMLNFNRWKEPSIGAEHFPPDAVPGEYKMKVVRDTGETFTSPFDGETRKIWEVDIALLYYDGQIDSDTFLMRFPVDVHPDDTVRVNYRIFSLVREDFSPTLVMLDRRQALNTVQFPYKGFDAVWIAFEPGQVLDVTVAYPPVRMVRGVYTWGWRVHPPRIQFLQPLYEIVNQHTGEAELDAQSYSFAYRNREDLTLDTIAEAAPEKKMHTVAKAVLEGATPAQVRGWLTRRDQGPRGTWVEWADLAKEQRQLPSEAWDVLEAEDGLSRGELGDYRMVSVYMNNEMYGQGPFLNELRGWKQGDTFEIKLINFDRHTHYFRNVDFGARVHDDILRCCGGGLTSFEVMNFKPSYGAPKVAEAQWRAGWGFRPHHDVLQQYDVFPRGVDRVKLAPYTGGFGDTFYGFLYSEEARGGDFRFNPPPFIITDEEHPSPDVLRDADGEAGLLLGQRTEGYGVAQMCPDDPYPGFCTTDIQQHNPLGVVNFPPPPLQGQPVLPPDVGKFPGDVYPDEPVELRFPPFLRNPAQGDADAGDIIPPTGAWEAFTWLNPTNGTLFIDPDDPSRGHWADLTYAHGAPVFAGQSLAATVELPRGSAQVFYQFDDLFHDNDIFSPHPLFSRPDESDAIDNLGVRTRGIALMVWGQVAELSTGERASWVTVFAGAAGESGCTGTVLGSAPVEGDGWFAFRRRAAVRKIPRVCVQSTIGGFADIALNP